MKRIIIIFISLVLIVFFSVFFVVSKNNKYISKLEKEIKDNYKIEEKITYLNKSNSHYIILTDNNLIVLDSSYQEIFKESTQNVDLDKNNYEIVYRLNQVMYEKKIVSKTKITYNYYDIYTKELIDTVSVGG